MEEWEGIFVVVLFLINLGGCYKGEEQIWRDWKVSETGVHDVKFLKNQNYKKFWTQSMIIILSGWMPLAYLYMHEDEDQC